MNVSTAQVKRTSNWEGFRSKAYKDGVVGGVQKYSIGYGHQIQVHETYLLTATITEAQALELLRKDFANVVKTINEKCKKVINQNQFDALADFGFNCGVGALAKVIATLNASGYAAVPAHMGQYIKWTPTPGQPSVVHPVLVKRRAENVDIWNSSTLFNTTLVAACLAIAFVYYYIQNNGKIPFLS